MSLFLSRRLSGQDVTTGNRKTMLQHLSSAESVARAFEEIFSALPPLDSPAYLRLLETAAPEELPAQVLVRAYRQLCSAGAEAPARATLERLVASPYRSFYLRGIHRLAQRHVARGQYAYDADDLVQEAIRVIVQVLPTARGAYAQSAWVSFCRQCFIEGWRVLNGRRGEKVRRERVEQIINSETGQEDDLLEVADDTVPWHVAMRESNLPWLEEFIRQTIVDMPDPLMRRVAEDQFGDDPSPISSGQSEGGKPPLTEQLGQNRYKISRLREQARARLFAALLEQREKDIDLDWVRKMYRGR